MPDAATLLVFAAAATLIILIPGPNHIYIAARSASQGRSAGIASALGVETGTLVHIAAAAIGLSALIASSAAAFDAVRYAGAAYLLFLGVRALRSRGGHTAAEPGRATRARAFAEGVVVNLLNPKVALFFLAFLPQFIDPQNGSTALQTLVLGLLMFAIGLTVDLLYALLAGALAGRLRRRATLDRVSGGILIALGAVAALSGGARR
jgi:threonine/homoserine/homoserine lactone efflux protein